MRKRRLIRYILSAFLALGIFTNWHLIRELNSEEERLIRQEFRQTLMRYFPEHIRHANRQFGLKKICCDNSSPSFHKKPPVVLVHGLDDPGNTWKDLVPHLVDERYSIWELRYPDDQPIEDSAVFFHEELQKLFQSNVQTVDIVAHSMGGLVSRELLSHTRYIKNEQIPKIRRLVMIGTPNHGSELARFRLLAEMHDQTAELFAGKFNWLGFIADGAGEAGIDLTPGSVFLQKINSRPSITDTQVVVIAGVLTQIEIDKIEGQIAWFNENTSNKLHASLTHVAKVLEKLINDVGDGLVTLESARLKNAEFHVVKGNHISMIRKSVFANERVPAAIPVVMSVLH